LTPTMDIEDLPSYVKTGVLLMCRCARKPFFVARILVVSVSYLVKIFLYSFVCSIYCFDAVG